MKIAVEILSTLSEPSTSNIQAMKETFVSLANDYSNKLNNQYDFYFYYGGCHLKHDEQIYIASDLRYKNCYNIELPFEETIYNTFEKGISVLKNITGYDWYIRINISCYLNILLLDKVIGEFHKDTVYCNAINSYINDEQYFNDLYPRGDMMIFSEKTRQGILSTCEKYIRCDVKNEDRLNIPHVDDCLFGLCLIDYFGADYFKHICMLNYNYIPDIDISEIKNVSLLCIGNRVKTNPPGISYSGYSWTDNEYRRFDAEKMRYLNDKFKEIKYTDIHLNDLLGNKRPTLYVTLSNRNIEDFYPYLKRKRGT